MITKGVSQSKENDHCIFGNQVTLVRSIKDFVLCLNCFD